MTDSVLLSFDNQIASLTLNRPDVHNAFNAEMIAALSDAFDGIAARDDIRTVVIRGEGKSFSAGADLNWMKDSINFTKEQNKDDAVKLAQMLNKLNTLPQLTIALVHGAAMGGGFGLVSCCDLVIAGPKALFSLSEVKLGLIPATIGPYVVQAIGPRHARRFFQTAERLDARKAYDIGLAHETAQSDDQMNEILASILDIVGKNGPNAMRASKKLALDLSDGDVSPETMNDTAQRIADIRTTIEAQERLNKFLNK